MGGVVSEWFKLLSASRLKWAISHSIALLYTSFSDPSLSDASDGNFPLSFSASEIFPSFHFLLLCVS